MLPSSFLNGALWRPLRSIISWEQRQRHHTACSARQTAPTASAKNSPKSAPAGLRCKAGNTIWHPCRDQCQRGFAIRILTTWTGGGSFAFSALRAKVRTWRFLTAAADISGSLGIRVSLNNASPLRVECVQKMASGRAAWPGRSFLAEKAGKACICAAGRR